MARLPDIERLKHAWDHLKAGGSQAKAGVHPTFAGILARCIAAGWDWETVELRLRTETGGLKGLASGLPAPPPKPAPTPASDPAPVPVPMVLRPESEPDGSKPKVIKKRETWEDRHRQKVTNQRLHREREIDLGRKLLDFGDKMLEVCSSYLQLKRKVTKREEECPHCAKPVVVEEIHIHPSKVDVQGIVRAYKEGADRIRIALNMPKQVLAVRVSDMHAELAERLQEMDEAFKQAFRQGIDRGLLTEQGAVEIWETARGLIEGTHGR